MKSTLVGSLACLLSLGCSAYVRVVDEKGRPVEGAAVLPISPSMNGGKILTNADGEVALPFSVQEWKWVEVSKRGYRRATVDISPSRPVKVVLTSEPGPQK